MSSRTPARFILELPQRAIPQKALKVSLVNSLADSPLSFHRSTRFAHVSRVTLSLIADLRREVLCERYASVRNAIRRTDTKVGRGP